MTKKLFFISLLFIFSFRFANGFADSLDQKTHMTVLAFGDAGTSDSAQYKVAKSMQNLCNTVGCNFGLLLGDNFYPAGVTSVNDPLFRTAFEVPYSPISIPFYIALGNHDYGNGPVKGNIAAQLEYANRNPQWVLPSRYYTFEKDNTEFFVLDTNTLSKETAQMEWFRNSFRSSSAKYKVVMAHHPIYSNGENGSTGYLIEKVLPILCESAQNTIYISGHDHHLEHLKAECGLNMVISGGGAYHRRVLGSSRSVFQAASTGFATLDIEDSGVELTFYNGNGASLYRTQILN